MNIISLNYDRIDPPVKYKFQHTARKNHTCEKCGCEIHKNELIWWWKPLPTFSYITGKKIYHKWRCRCMDCEPKRQSEVELYYES